MAVPTPASSPPPDGGGDHEKRAGEERVVDVGQSLSETRAESHPPLPSIGLPGLQAGDPQAQERDEGDEWVHRADVDDVPVEDVGKEGVQEGRNEALARRYPEASERPLRGESGHYDGQEPVQVQGHPRGAGRVVEKARHPERQPQAERPVRDVGTEGSADPGQSHRTFLSDALDQGGVHESVAGVFKRDPKRPLSERNEKREEGRRKEGEATVVRKGAAPGPACRAQLLLLDQH
jgi:hypothetical protein